MMNLLEKVNLQNRASYSFDSVDPSEISYELVQKKLDDYRATGMNFLKEGLEITV